MQFTHAAVTAPPLYPNGHHGLGLGLFLDVGAPRARPWPAAGSLFPTLPPSSKISLGNLNSAGCMEQLLVHCANAIEANDATLTQQILWVLNNIAPADGDSNQRLTAAFLCALVARASRTGACKAVTAAVAAAVESAALHVHRFTAVELASFVDLTPWHRFGYMAANHAILEAVEGFSVVHVVDLSTTHCMQIPTLIDMLASRAEGPPILRLTVADVGCSGPPPALDMSYDELGAKLVNFARSRNVTMDFRMVPTSPADAFTSLVDQLRVQQLVSDGTEALILNCHMLLHTVPDETAGSDRARWGQRMRGAGFRAVAFGEEAAGEIRTMLNEHAAGWGMKREDDDLMLTWKGHNVVFASAWAPS
ncbi:unnamed protein product [Triticum turgidum subsp. durum]|uniref:Scarecrow-like protein 32 n=1 Tax=Triticum turgidum subsp. durum TaxID=4567 RepID=A0A9R1RJZ5_TRITD|nr:unnamed protein product [Triticum turgidum subsp. durum]